MSVSRRDRLSSRASLEAWAFCRCFYPHRDNSSLRKWTTLVLFGVWAILTVGMLFGMSIDPNVYWPIFAVVLYILGRQHEAEFARLIGRY